MSHANKDVIAMFASRNKCWQCKRKFDRPVLLPVAKPTRGQFKPNINTEVLFHLQDTHGIPKETVTQWIIGAVYGEELTPFGVRGVTDM